MNKKHMSIILFVLGWLCLILALTVSVLSRTLGIPRLNLATAALGLLAVLMFVTRFRRF